MGRLVEISGPRNKSERPAQERLAEILPSNWIVTTNIKERQFQYNKREIDCLIICPLGIFNIDLKNHDGPITPLVNDEWRGVKYDGGKKDNPFDQGENAVYTVKQHLQMRHPGDRWWIEWLVVLTSADATLDWSGSDCEEFQRARVCILDDVQKHIELLSKTLCFKPDARQAQSVLEAFKARDLPSHIAFIADNWPAPASTQNRAQPRSDKRASARPHTVSGGSADRGRDDPSIGSEFERMFSSRPAAQIQPESREIWNNIWNPRIGYSIGLVICVCVALYAVFRLTYCDGACENRKTSRAQREWAAHARSQQEEQKQKRLAYMKARNTSPNCPGQVIETEETEKWRNFNPNHCAVMWRVIRGRLVFEGLYPWLHWEVWPGGNDPDIQPPWEVRSKFGVSKWRYILCEYNTEQFQKAAREGRFECF
jgi:hypothetical protein